VNFQIDAEAEMAMYAQSAVILGFAARAEFLEIGTASFWRNGMLRPAYANARLA